VAPHCLRKEFRSIDGICFHAGMVGETARMRIGNQPKALAASANESPKHNTSASSACRTLFDSHAASSTTTTGASCAHLETNCAALAPHATTTLADDASNTRDNADSAKRKLPHGNGILHAGCKPFSTAS